MSDPTTPNPSDAFAARVLISCAAELADCAARLARMGLTPMPLTENANLQIGSSLVLLEANLNKLRMLAKGA